MYTSFHSGIGVISTHFFPNILGLMLAFASHYLADNLQEYNNFNDSRIIVAEICLTSYLVADCRVQSDWTWLLAGIVAANTPDVLYALFPNEKMFDHEQTLCPIFLTKEQTILLNALMIGLATWIINSDNSNSGNYKILNDKYFLEKYKVQDSLFESYIKENSYFGFSVNELDTL